MTVAGAAGPGASVATAGLWSAPAPLGEGGSAVLADVAINDAATAVVAWSGNGAPVRVAMRPAGAPFGPIETLAPDGGEAVAAALNGRGDALIAWSRSGALGLAERAWGEPEFTAVPTTVAGIKDGPDVAFVENGRAVVVWAGTDGAVHLLTHDLGGDTVTSPDLAPAPGNSSAHVGAAGGHAVATWTATETSGSQVTTHVRASVLPPGGTFGAAEDIASATSDTQSPSWTGSQLSAGSVAVSPGGAADVLVHALEFLGVTGEFGAAGLVAARPMGAWTPQQRLGSAIGLQLGGQYHADLAAGSAGDALYVDGERSDFAPTMRFSARRRAVDGTLYGERSTLHAGAQGEIRAAQSTPRRFLVLMRSGGGLRSRAGSPATGFEAPLVFSATNASRLLGLAGAKSGLAVAAWVTTSGRVQAAIYDDSLGPASLPPVAALDTVAPVLSRLSLSPRRFAVRRRSPRSAAARGTRIRWRLSEPARVTLRVDRVRLGFRRGERCVARRPRTGGVRRCKRYSRVGSFARTAQAGRTALRFNGRVRRRALRRGPLPADGDRPRRDGQPIKGEAGAIQGRAPLRVGSVSRYPACP